MADRLVEVELSRQEVHALLMLVRGRAAEMERMVQNLEEQEGMDLQRHNLLRNLRPQVEGLNDLVLKLDIAAKELEPESG